MIDLRQLDITEQDLKLVKTLSDLSFGDVGDLWVFVELLQKWVEAEKLFFGSQTRRHFLSLQITDVLLTELEQFLHLFILGQLPHVLIVVKDSVREFSFLLRFTRLYHTLKVALHVRLLWLLLDSY